MSSSLFDSFGKNDAYYAPTKYSDGDKRFEEIDTNDILYYVSQYGEIEEIISNGKLKQYKGHIILSTIRNGKQFTIDFGTTNCGNTYECYKNSITAYDHGYIGTNKNTIIELLIKDKQEKLNKLIIEVDSLQFSINKLKDLNNEKSS